MRYLNFLNKDNKVVEILDISGRYRVSRCIEIGLEDNLKRSFFVSEGEKKEIAIAITDKIVHSDFSEYVDNLNLIKNVKGKAMENTTVTTEVIENTIDLSIKAKNSLVDLVKAIEYSQDELASNNSTLKKIKESLAVVTSEDKYLQEGVQEDIIKLNPIRTKDAYIKGLSEILDRVNASINVLSGQIEKAEDEKAKALEAIEVKEEIKPGLTKENVAKLFELAGLIQHSIQVATNAHMNAGEYLNEGLILHKNAGLSSKEWEKWAGLACQVKRAQAYNLVKIWNTFGADSDFAGCSMRVLNIMVHLKREDFEKIEQDAKSLAKIDKLDTKTVNSLIDRIKPIKPVPVKEESIKEVPVKEESDLITKTLSDSIKQTVKQDTPEIDEDSTEQDNVEGLIETPEKPVMDDKDRLIEELREQNLQLLDKIAELTKAVKESKPETKVLHLPQFNESEPYLVLGINPCADKEEILKRYRSMAVIFNAKTCPTGAIALKNAKDSLIANCEK